MVDTAVLSHVTKVPRQRDLFVKLARQELPPVILICGHGPERCSQVRGIITRAVQTNPDGGLSLSILDATYKADGSPQFVRSSVAHSLLSEKRPVIIFCNNPKALPSLAMQINRFIPGVPLISVNVDPKTVNGDTMLDYQWRLPNGPASREKSNGQFKLSQDPRADIQSMIAVLSACAIENARVYAEEVLKPKSVCLADATIPKAVMELVRGHLTVGARPSGSYVCAIKGGTAAAMYLGALSRPVSMDVDFCTHGALPTMLVEKLMSALAIGRYTTQGVPADGGAWNEIAKSTKWSGTTEINGEAVEVDIVPVRRVTKLGFCFQFQYDSYLHYMRREVSFESGERAFIIPPELLIAEKLAASRGREEGKWDLYDVAGLLVTQRIDYSVLTHLIDVQRFNLLTDEAPLLLSPEHQPHALEMNLRLRGFKDGKLIELISHKICRLKGDAPISDAQLQILNGHDLKKLALVDLYLTTIGKIVAEMNIAGDEIGKPSIAIRFGADKVLAACAKLRKTLVSYATHQVGTIDTYVKQD